MIDPFDVIDVELHKRNDLNRSEVNPAECWGNLYPGGNVSYFATRSRADDFAGPLRVRCIHYSETLQ